MAYTEESLLLLATCFMMHSTVTFEEVELLARTCLYIADTISVVVVNVMKMKISSALSLGISVMA